MTLYPISNTSIKLPLKEAVMNPLADNGDLYMPHSLPVIPSAMFRHLDEFSLSDIAFIVTNLMFGDEIPADALKQIINDTLTFDIPLRQLNTNVWSLELFHGPSQSVKDTGMRFLSNLIRYFHGADSDQNLNILVATAGPSLETVIKAFGSMPGVRAFILYPSSRANRIEFNHVGCNYSNIIPIEVNGTFDECHALIKRAFTDPELMSSTTLISANSLNIARLMSQTIYYFWAYASIIKAKAMKNTLYFSIPSGNLGNLCAAIMAKKMGLPITGFIAAENINCPLNRYLLNGTTDPIPTETSLATALDVSVPSNLPRLARLYNNNLNMIRQEITSRSINDDTISDTIFEVYNKYGYELNPHSAVAYAALVDTLPNDANGVFLSTSSPDKSRRIINNILGKDIQDNNNKKTSGNDIRPLHINPSYVTLKKILLTS